MMNLAKLIAMAILAGAVLWLGLTVFIAALIVCAMGLVMFWKATWKWWLVALPVLALCLPQLVTQVRVGNVVVNTRAGQPLPGIQNHFTDGVAKQLQEDARTVRERNSASQELSTAFVESSGWRWAKAKVRPCPLMKRVQVAERKVQVPANDATKTEESKTREMTVPVYCFEVDGAYRLDLNRPFRVRDDAASRESTPDGFLVTVSQPLQGGNLKDQKRALTTEDNAIWVQGWVYAEYVSSDPVNEDEVAASYGGGQENPAENQTTSTAQKPSARPKSDVVPVGSDWTESEVVVDAGECYEIGPFASEKEIKSLAIRSGLGKVVTDLKNPYPIEGGLAVSINITTPNPLGEKFRFKSTGDPMTITMKKLM